PAGGSHRAPGGATPSRYPPWNDASYTIRRNGCLIAPEILEPIRCQLGVTHSVLDVAMAEPCLQGPGVVAGIGQRVAATVEQHVRVDGEGHLGPNTNAAEQGMKAFRRHRAAALGLEHIRGWRTLALQTAQ